MSAMSEDEVQLAAKIASGRREIRLGLLGLALLAGVLVAVVVAKSHGLLGHRRSRFMPLARPGEATDATQEPVQDQPAAIAVDQPAAEQPTHEVAALPAEPQFGDLPATNEPNTALSTEDGSGEVAPPPVASDSVPAADDSTSPAEPRSSGTEADLPPDDQVRHAAAVMPLGSGRRRSRISASGERLARRESAAGTVAASAGPPADLPPYESEQPPPDTTSSRAGDRPPAVAPVENQPTTSAVQPPVGSAAPPVDQGNWPVADARNAPADNLNQQASPAEEQPWQQPGNVQPTYEDNPQTAVNAGVGQESPADPYAAAPANPYAPTAGAPYAGEAQPPSFEANTGPAGSSQEFAAEHSAEVPPYAAAVPGAPSDPYAAQEPSAPTAGGDAWREGTGQAPEPEMLRIPLEAEAAAPMETPEVDAEQPPVSRRFRSPRRRDAERGDDSIPAAPPEQEVAAESAPPTGSENSGDVWPASGEATAGNILRYPTEESPAAASSAARPRRAAPPRRGVEEPGTPDQTVVSGAPDDFARGTAVPPGEQAEPAAADEYVVRPHDTYWTISQERYGTGAYFKALYEHNRRTYPRADKLRAGDRLIAPEAAELERLYPDLIPRLPAHGRQHAPQPHRAEAPIPSDREYVVHAGDTLFDIARYELGKASRWNEIYELNREAIGENFNRLRPGTRLVLPAERNEILSRQETEAWQR